MINTNIQGARAVPGEQPQEVDREPNGESGLVLQGVGTARQQHGAKLKETIELPANYAEVLEDFSHKIAADKTRAYEIMRDFQAMQLGQNQGTLREQFYPGWKDEHFGLLFRELVMRGAPSNFQDKLDGHLDNRKRDPSSHKAAVWQLRDYLETGADKDRVVEMFYKGWNKEEIRALLWKLQQQQQPATFGPILRDLFALRSTDPGAYEQVIGGVRDAIEDDNLPQTIDCPGWTSEDLHALLYMLGEK